MVLKLYYIHQSPPSRMVVMTLKALGLDYEEVIVKMFEGEHKKPEFLKINPRGKVPCLLDDNYVIAESRAISCYLCNQYEKGDNRLYPTDPKQRGLVDQILYVSENTNDMMMAYINVGGVLFRGEKPNEEKIGEVKKALDLYEGYLSKTGYIASNGLTLADFFMASPLLMLDLPGYDDFKDYPKTTAWLAKIKAVPYFDESNKEGMTKMKEMYQNALKK